MKESVAVPPRPQHDVIRPVQPRTVPDKPQQEVPPTQLGVNGVLTLSKFYEIMDEFKKDVFKPP